MHMMIIPAQGGQTQAAQSTANGSTDAGQGFSALLVQQVGAPAAPQTQTAGQSVLASLLYASDLAAYVGEKSEAEAEMKLEELLNLLNAEQNGEEAVEEDTLLNLMAELGAIVQSMYGFVPFKGTDLSGQQQGQAQLTLRAELVETLSFLKEWITKSGAEPQNKQQWQAFQAQLSRMIQHLKPAAAEEIKTVPSPEIQAIASKLQAMNNAAGIHLVKLSHLPVGQTVLQTILAPMSTDQQLTGQMQDQASAAPQISAHAAAPDQASQPAKPQLMQQPVPVHKFSETMGALVKQFGFKQTSGITEARLTLTPEHLGQVDVRISIQKGVLTAQFIAENGMARDLIEAQLSQLRGSLQSQGLQVERLEVTQQQSSSNLQGFSDQKGKGGNNQAHDQQKSGREGREGSDSFENELIEQIVENGLGYGRALNVTA